MATGDPLPVLYDNPVWRYLGLPSAVERAAYLFEPVADAAKMDMAASAHISVPRRYGVAPLLADAVIREWRLEAMPVPGATMALFRCDMCQGRFGQDELSNGKCRACFESMPVAGLSSRTHEQDDPGKVDVGGYEWLVVASYSPDPLLPPDPDAFGSLHWLQHGNGAVWPAMWCRRSAASDQPHFRPLSPESRECAAAEDWRYHSQMVIPALLAPPEDLEIDRVWAAVQDLGKR